MRLMTAKELNCLGVALEALMEAEMYTAVKQVIISMKLSDKEKKELTGVIENKESAK